MAHEETKVHECECENNWRDINFDSAELVSDGRLALRHDCGEHEGEACVHLLSAEITEIIRAVLTES